MYAFKELLEEQRKLDLNIIQTKKLDNEDRTLKKLAAFTTELGEMVNELPETFKFWANKKNDKQKALVEYVDGIHFILGLAVDLGIEDIRILNAEVSVYTKESFLEQVLYLNTIPNKISTRGPSHQKRWVEILMAAYIGLGQLIGFEWDEVVEAYHKKNKINHDRQDANY
ncbi:dUTP diphosphatase [Bacillus sp. ISL-57]|uniref:dUTP diphosphatase n=1 Tax=Bacillus sp. ISL-57 TaxID=2819135 RepID=UPI001BE6666A|nr:dUTP diphosphatase [Bacillus sp. ISL-57]MBT2718296.1 dUTP diphosphatase [Bacillus sp. ISL-57]